LIGDEIMTERPLWLLIEDKILEVADQDLSKDRLERTVQRIAGELDEEGHNVSCHAGNMLRLRWALDSRLEKGRPLLKDFQEATGRLGLEDVLDPSAATMKLVHDVGAAWPALKESDRRSDVLRIIEKTRLDLLIAKAKGLGGDAGIRFLIESEVAPEVITEALGISEEEYSRVLAAVEAERALRAEVAKLLEAVEGRSDEERVKHLVNNSVADEMIVEMAGVDQSVVDGVKQAMEEELKEKQRLAEEEAARKKAEAEGPALDAIPPDELLEYIESIREILEFSEKEDEIRVMCEQSNIPKALVEIAVSNPDQLDDLESKAEG
jgi:hypothetical protein